MVCEAILDVQRACGACIMLGALLFVGRLGAPAGDGCKSQAASAATLLGCVNSTIRRNSGLRTTAVCTICCGAWMQGRGDVGQRAWALGCRGV